MAQFQTEGIVLKQFDLGEADKIITFYTKDKGKVRAVARGARKSKSKLSGIVLPFSYNEITIYRGRSIDRINHVENLYSFTALREDLNLMAYSSYMAELIEKVGKEDNPNEGLFSLLLSIYYKLNKKKGDINWLDRINLQFKASVLKVLGFMPELKLCIDCNKQIKPKKQNYFSIAHGGLLCVSCSKKQENSYDDTCYQLNGESLVILRRLIQSNGSLPDNLKISDQAYLSLNKLIDRFISYHLDINIKSEEFLHMIRKLG